MRGVVKYVSSHRETFAVETRMGLTVVEFLDACGVEVGDEIEGALDHLAGERLENVTRGERFDAFIQAIHATEQTALGLLG